MVGCHCSIITRSRSFESSRPLQTPRVHSFAEPWVMPGSGYSVGSQESKGSKVIGGTSLMRTCTRCRSLCEYCKQHNERTVMIYRCLRYYASS